MTWYRHKTRETWLLETDDGIQEYYLDTEKKILLPVPEEWLTVYITKEEYFTPITSIPQQALLTLLTHKQTT